jgi:hypothetical protein
MTNGVLEIFKNFKWNRAAIMWENIPLWTKHKDTLVELLKENNISVSSTKSFISINKYTPKKHVEMFRNALEVLKGKARS